MPSNRDGPICTREPCVASGECGCSDGGNIEARLEDAIERVLRWDGNPGGTQRAIQLLREAWEARNAL